VVIPQSSAGRAQAGDAEIVQTGGRQRAIAGIHAISCGFGAAGVLAHIGL